LNYPQLLLWCSHKSVRAESYFLNLQPEMFREQPLLPLLDVLNVGWEMKRLAQGADAETVPKIYPGTPSLQDLHL